MSFHDTNLEKRKYFLKSSNFTTFFLNNIWKINIIRFFRFASKPNFLLFSDKNLLINFFQHFLRFLSWVLFQSIKTLYLCDFSKTPKHKHYCFILMAAVEEKTRYSEEELKEFEEIITQKLEATRNELNFIRETLSRKNDNGTEFTANSTKLMEDGADVSEKEQLSQSAGRLQKFAQQLEAALIRIKNGTYGICRDTGKLIPKERLRAVPHTQQTIEAKLKASN
ncbi:transcriptional regulator, TraR/DksA family [Emticicia oligotrophica DSM 17448]|uniref:Transcriptional regulator, TraR/DksA family n=2 Tax=Emticicia TaxID=312278 RepID=A0ABN4AL56_EMTOG|nr:transcriptional regulator, TraR/DksA family [Emticicia oligotrophica DSM 17448]